MLFAYSKPRPSWTSERWVCHRDRKLVANQKMNGFFSLSPNPKHRISFTILSSTSQGAEPFLLPQPSCLSSFNLLLFVFYTVRELRRPRVQVHRVLWECKPQSITLGCSPHFCLRRQLAQCHSADTVLFVAWDSEWQVVKPKGRRA